jgi:CRISPR-associated endoribonuclease Cas6
MPNLYSSVILLLAEHDSAPAFSGGQHAHAAFLHDIIGGVDPELASALHDQKARKPFTVSPLQGLPRSGATEVRAGRQYWLRVTILDEGLFGRFLERFIYGEARPGLRLGDAHFLVSEILTTPGSHPWAGYTTLEALQARLEESAPHRLAFELYTPTAFGWKDGSVFTLPLPQLVFGNLARAWEMLSGEDPVAAIESYAQENLLPGSFDLRTQAFTMHNKPQLGAVGRVEYVRHSEEDHPLGRALNLLADLAFFTGIGRKTTQGMGQCRRLVT